MFHFCHQNVQIERQNVSFSPNVLGLQVQISQTVLMTSLTGIPADVCVCVFPLLQVAVIIY